METNIFYSHSFITSLIFTVVSETVVLVFLLRKFLHIPKEKISTLRILFAGFFASFATIPYVWYVFPNLTDWTRDTSVHYSEIFAFLLEAIFYKVFLKTNNKNSLWISLLCNSISFSLGVFLRMHGWWFYW